MKADRKKYLYSTTDSKYIAIWCCALSNKIIHKSYLNNLLSQSSDIDEIQKCKND